MNSKKINLENFDFTQFKKEAIDRLKSGESLTGKDGILTPLLKEILEAALEGEMDAHLLECREAGQSNRRNGKLQKTWA
jgi:putative transposase